MTACANLRVGYIFGLLLTLGTLNAGFYTLSWLSATIIRGRKHFMLEEKASIPKHWLVLFPQAGWFETEEELPGTSCGWKRPVPKHHHFFEISLFLKRSWGFCSPSRLNSHLSLFQFHLSLSGSWNPLKKQAGIFVVTFNTTGPAAPCLTLETGHVPNSKSHSEGPWRWKCIVATGEKVLQRHYLKRRKAGWKISSEKPISTMSIMCWSDEEKSKTENLLEEWIWTEQNEVLDQTGGAEDMLQTDVSSRKWILIKPHTPCEMAGTETLKYARYPVALWVCKKLRFGFCGRRNNRSACARPQEPGWVSIVVVESALACPWFWRVFTDFEKCSFLQNN